MASNMLWYLVVGLITAFWIDLLLFVWDPDFFTNRPKLQWIVWVLVFLLWPLFYIWGIYFFLNAIFENHPDPPATV